MKTVGTFSTPTASSASANNYGPYYLIRFCLEGLRKLAVYGTKTPYKKNKDFLGINQQIK